VESLDRLCAQWRGLANQSGLRAEGGALEAGGRGTALQDVPNLPEEKVPGADRDTAIAAGDDFRSGFSTLGHHAAQEPKLGLTRRRHDAPIQGIGRDIERGSKKLSRAKRAVR